VGLGGEVDDAVGVALVEHAPDSARISDVDLLKGVVRGVGYLGNGVEVTGVGELVDVDDADVGAGETADQGRTDEAGAAGDEECGHVRKIRRDPWLRTRYPAADNWTVKLLITGTAGFFHTAPRRLGGGNQDVALNHPNDYYDFALQGAVAADDRSRGFPLRELHLTDPEKMAALLERESFDGVVDLVRDVGFQSAMPLDVGGCAVRGAVSRVLRTTIHADLRKQPVEYPLRQHDVGKQ
jgi:hypothetical protein